jgi:hypothetical protein
MSCQLHASAGVPRVPNDEEMGGPQSQLGFVIVSLIS